MTDNLGSDYLFIKSSFPDYHVIDNAAISYIKTLSGNENVIFLCKQNKDEILSNNSNSLIKSSDKTDLDLTGSPLKDNCSFENLQESLVGGLTLEKDCCNKIEQSYIGIDVQKAKQILNIILFESSNHDSEDSLWVLCDASDTAKTVLIEVGFDTKWNKRGIVLYKGLVPTEEINIMNFLNAHMSQLRGTIKVDIYFESFFDIAPSTTLKLNWNTSSLQPSLTNYKDCDITLFQKFEIGNINSVAEHFWRQQIILSIIRDDIIAYKNAEEDNTEPMYTCGSGIEMDTLREKIQHILTEVATENHEDSTIDSNEIEAVIHQASIRTSLDVTDKLWDTLKFCASYRDLKSAFAFIFQCAAKCNIVNMPPSQNRLAEIIREVSTQRLAVPCLSGSEPLELLLEIGLEKLSKDYEFVFSQCRISGLKNLDVNRRQSLSSTAVQSKVRKSLHAAVLAPAHEKERKTLLHTNARRESSTDRDNIGFQNSRFSKKDVECKLAKLAQIHLILEHILLVHTHLMLENVYNDICDQLLKRPLRNFDDLKKLDFDYLEMPLTTDQILHRVENKSPTARRISMTSENVFKKVSTTYYCSLNSIFPTNVVTGISNDDNSVTKRCQYHVYQYSQISSKRH